MSKSAIRRQFEPLSTETLLDILNKNDREYFSDNVFEVVSEILTDRNAINIDNSTSKSNENLEVDLSPLPESTETAKPIWVFAFIFMIIGILFIIYTASK